MSRWHWWTGMALIMLLGCPEWQPAIRAADPSLEKLIAQPAPLSVTERIDQQFARVVDVIEGVMFRRLFQTERSSIIYSHQADYVRDRGTTGPFVFYSSTAPVTDSSLTDQQVLLLSARGELAPGQTIDGQSQPFRHMRAEERLLEVVTVRRGEELPNVAADTTTPLKVMDGARFVQTTRDGKTVYVLVGPMRGLLDETQWLSQTTVDELAQKGRLATGDDGRTLLIEKQGGIPIVVLWLAVGGVVATLYFGFLNIRAFPHAIACVGGKYDDPREPGEVNHFQALSSALSGTVGLGNIAGVTIAMTSGGPGAFFWMMMSGFLGMSLKFVECSLAVKYRQIHADGSVLGGPMRYLSLGLAKRNLGPLGKVLAVAFTFMCILGSFGGGNMIQVNQSSAALLQVLEQADHDRLQVIQKEIKEAADRGDEAAVAARMGEKKGIEESLSNLEAKFKPIYGVVMAAMVAVVILGGIRRIGKAAEIMVPGMCVIYLLICGWVVLRHITEVPALFGLIFSEAFSPQAIHGGVLGVLVIGVQRAVFSNEAGAGSAPIAHSAAKTNEPIREGLVALLEPFIDTIVICSATALAMLICGAWNNPVWSLDQGLQGAALTSRAFREEVSWFPYVLSFAVMLFAYSTIISWAYYGERCWETLFGRRSTPLYKLLCVLAVFVGAVSNLKSVLNFSDMMILGMAFPNVLGLYFLMPEVRADLKSYWKRLGSPPPSPDDSAESTAV